MQNLDHPLPRGYMVRYRTPQHTQTKKRGFPTKRAAEAFANTVEVEKLTGNYVAPSLAQVTVGELGKEWLARQAHYKASWSARLESVWRIHVEPHQGDARLSSFAQIHPITHTTPVAPDNTGDYCAVRMTKASVFSS